MTIHHVFYSSDAPPGRYVAVVLYSFIKVIQTKGSGVILVDRLIPLLNPPWILLHPGAQGEFACQLLSTSRVTKTSTSLPTTPMS